jgi:hypothetical protein
MNKVKVDASRTLMFLLLVLMGVLTACGGAAEATPEAIVEVVEIEKETVSSEAMSADTETDSSMPLTIQEPPPNFGRMIIKDAELGLVVESTDVAINRTLRMVADHGGYVVSNQTWLESSFKYATMTIGVPSENFENMLRRLKDMAVTVNTEAISGEDVTDQYVDLKSRLRNLEATAARVRDFLDQANDVDKALDVSNKLSDVEAEIEQVKGRMAYLKDRAAYSTITLQLVPQMPTPTATPTPAWSAAKTLDSASTAATESARTLFQIGTDIFIWSVVFVLPYLVPIIILFWLGRKLWRRFNPVQAE